MSRKARGQIRRSQAITTWGPGALLDLPKDATIVGGLDTWPKTKDLDEIDEPRLSSKLQLMTGIKSPRLFAPPGDSNDPGEPIKGISAWRFPEWFVVQEEPRADQQVRARRLVNRRALDEKGRFEKLAVVPTRFVRACPRGHIDDIGWHRFVHGDNPCRRQLWLDESGTGGDLGDLKVRCECGMFKGMHEASVIDLNPLSICRGQRPWLGPRAAEDCNLPSRLLIRTAANAYFPQVLSVLSLPDRGNAVQAAVDDVWQFVHIANDLVKLQVVKQFPRVSEALVGLNDDEVLEAILQRKRGGGEDRPLKQVELDAILSAPEGFGDDVPVDPHFHARRLPDRAWRRTSRSDGIEAVIQLHRLREVQALVGFTRFEAVTPDINGEYESDVQRATLAIEPQWFPAVENRGEGLFVQLRAKAIAAWLARPAVRNRVDDLVEGHKRFLADRGVKGERPFPGGPYVLMHTLSHLLIQSLAMRSGYPASSIRERVYADAETGRYGILLYTGTPDAEGTLGGLVQQARHVEAHLGDALRMAALCSNDPICAQHDPAEGDLEGRLLQGAACHGCTLISETSCEMRNDYLDRALVVPTVTPSDASYFGTAG